MTGFEIFALAATAASTAVATLGARRQAKAQSQASRFNAKVAQQNAKLARQRAQAEAAQIERQNRLRLGSIKARAGGAGLQVQGSVIGLIGDTVAQGELERQNRIFEGELQARGFNIQASADRASARDARSAGSLRVAGTLLGGASQAGTQLEEFGIVGGP